mgnify:CR=1 FL=1
MAALPATLVAGGLAGGMGLGSLRMARAADPLPRPRHRGLRGRWPSSCPAARAAPGHPLPARRLDLAPQGAIRARGPAGLRLGRRLPTRSAPPRTGRRACGIPRAPSSRLSASMRMRPRTHFRALPGVEVRDDEAQRSAVLRIGVLPVIPEDEQHVRDGRGPRAAGSSCAVRASPLWPHTITCVASRCGRARARGRPAWARLPSGCRTCSSASRNGSRT